MLKSPNFHCAVKTMVAVEISLLDIVLMVAITIFVALFVTVLIKLKPSSETTIDEYAEKQQKKHAASAQTPQLGALEDRKPFSQTSKPMTIAEAIQMHQTTTATVETAKEPEAQETAKTPKAPPVYIKNQRNTELKKEITKASEKPEIQKAEERQHLTPPSIQTPASSERNVNSDLARARTSLECSHYFGYLRTLPRNASIPDECFGCNRIVECFKQS
jgi:hypothetical protein